MTAAVVALVGAGAVPLTGCGTSQTSGAGMMNGSHGSYTMSSTASGASGMMGGSGSGYHYSALSCAAPASLPGTRVIVRLADMGMTQMMGGTASLGQRMTLQSSRASVPAGRVSFVAQNIGWRTHELVILSLPGGTAPGRRVASSDGKVAETGSLGEASGSCTAGAGKGITSGSTGWVTLSLPAGRFEIVCNLPNHYADGMRQELNVTS